MHLSDDILHQWMDGELAPAQQNLTRQHLDACPACSQRLQILQSRSARVNVVLQTLAPQRGEAPRPAAHAFRILPSKEKTSMFKQTPSLRWRPAWIALITVAVLATSLAFEPVRAFASGLLQIFRVQQVTVLPVNFSNLQNVNFSGGSVDALQKLFSDSVVITTPRKNSVDVDDAAKAASLAGFNLRMPSTQPDKLTVEYGTAFNFTVDLARMQEMIRQLGFSQQLPASLDGAKIGVNIPTSVSASYGNCQAESVDPDMPVGSSNSTFTFTDSGSPRDCLVYNQIPSPSVSTPPGVDVAQLAATALEMLGTSPDEAAAYSQKIDWATTLVLPIPRGETSYKDITIDGVPGSLIRQTNSGGGYVIVWVKNGIIYTVVGNGDEARGLALASELK